MFNEFAEGDGGTTFVPDLTAPSKEGLIYLLRNESKRPDGFKFNFQECRTCAMGLASAAWPELVHKKPGFAELGDISDAVSDAIGISRESGRMAFFEGGYKDPLTVSAEDVAAMLETV